MFRDVEKGNKTDNKHKPGMRGSGIESDYPETQSYLVIRLNISGSRADL